MLAQHLKLCGLSKMFLISESSCKYIWITFVFSSSPQRGKSQNKSDSRPEEGRKGRSPDRRRRGRSEESPKRMEIREVLCCFGSHRGICTLLLFKGGITHTVSPNLMLILSTYTVVLHQLTIWCRFTYHLQLWIMTGIFYSWDCSIFQYQTMHKSSVELGFVYKIFVNKQTWETLLLPRKNKLHPLFT